MSGRSHRPRANAFRKRSGRGIGAMPPRTSHSWRSAWQCSLGGRAQGSGLWTVAPSHELPVDGIAQDLAKFERRCPRGDHDYGLARGGIAARPGGTAPGRERAESRDGDGLPVGQGVGDMPAATFELSSDQCTTGSPLKPSGRCSNAAAERVGRATAGGDAGHPPEDALLQW